MPAKYIDYSGYAVAYAAEVSDAGKGADAITRQPIKVGVDSGKGVDAYDRTVIWYRDYADTGLSVDYVRRGVAKPVWDYPYVHEYLFKLVGRMMSTLESVVCSDWYKMGVLRSFADAGLVIDRVMKERSKALFDFCIALDLLQIAGWVYVELRDFLVGEHVPVKDVTLRKADTNVSADFLVRDVLKPNIDVIHVADYFRRLWSKVLADAGVSLDFVVRTLSKALVDAGLWFDWYSKDIVWNFLEWAVSVDWVLTPGLRMVTLIDLAVVRHILIKDVMKIGVESVTSVDWKAFDLACCLIDAVRGLDGAYRYFPVVLRDYLLAEHEIGFGRAWSFRDKAKMEELVAKLGFTLMGQEVWRRVYHRVWYDLIEVADQNTKIVIAQALIDAFKALYDKLKG
jgi:hypothetical protein